MAKNRKNSKSKIKILLEKKLSDLNLKRRTYFLLEARRFKNLREIILFHQAGVKAIGRHMNEKKSPLLKVNGFGQNMLEEIERILKQHGASLDMDMAPYL